MSNEIDRDAENEASAFLRDRAKADSPLMPSNPTLPEDVQTEAARIIQAMFADAPTPGEVVSAVAPLIIEWARKDQAENSSHFNPRKGLIAALEAHADWMDDGTGETGMPLSSYDTRGILAQFTPETTGGTTNG